MLLKSTIDFFVGETLTLGAGAIESKPAQMLAQQGVKAMVRAAGREAAQILATKVTRDLMLRVGASVGRQALWDAAKEGGLGAMIGGAMGWKLEFHFKIHAGRTAI